MFSSCQDVKPRSGFRIGLGLPLSVPRRRVPEIYERVGAETVPESAVDGGLQRRVQPQRHRHTYPRKHKNLYPTEFKRIRIRRTPTVILQFLGT